MIFKVKILNATNSLPKLTASAKEKRKIFLIEITGILPNFIIKILWLHHSDFGETFKDKGRKELCQSVYWCFEQILQAPPYKTTTVWLLSSHLTDHLIKTRKTRWVWQAIAREVRATHKRCSNMDLYTWTH